MSIDAHAFIYLIADKISDGINPLLIGLILEEPLIRSDARSSSAGGATFARALFFYIRSLLAISLAVTLAELGKEFQVWRGHPNFPSGHTTFAAAAATCIVLQRGRAWLCLVGPLAVMMALALAYGHWHTPAEVAAALIFGPLVAIGMMQLTGLRSRR